MAIDSHNELSNKQLIARLRSEAWNHPLTLGAGVVGVLSGVGAGLFLTTDAFIALAAISGVGLLSSISHVFNKTVLGKHRAMLKIIEEVRKETMAKRNEMTTAVKRDLEKFNDQRSLMQLEQLEAKFAAFQNVLNLQFDEDELTHKRYLTTAEQLYFGAVDNLKRVAMLWNSVTAINVSHLQKQLASEELSEQETDAIKKRLAIHQQSEQDRKDIISINEEAMTSLDAVTIALGGIQTKDGLSDVKLDTAMDEIMHLISRVDNYNRT